MLRDITIRSEPSRAADWLRDKDQGMLKVEIYAEIMRDLLSESGEDV